MTHSTASAPVATHDAPVSPQTIRAALGMFATGVTIITTQDASGELRGLTANSFNSVSLSPPLVLWSLVKTSSSFDAFTSASHYAINVLTAEQLPLAQRFATRGIDRWAGVAHEAGAGGAPVLPESAAIFECKHHSSHDAGDHVLFIGEVIHCRHAQDAKPLLFHGGRFYTELPISPAEAAQ